MLLLFFSSWSLADNSKNPLPGAWLITGVEWQSAERTSALTDVQPGLFIFTDDHYALMWSPENQPRNPFQVLAKPTNEEIIAGFRSIVFNGGRYLYSPGKLVTTAVVAKVPGFESGQQFFFVETDEGELTLTFYDEIYPDGSRPEWSGTWKTVFTLKKAAQ